MSFNWISQIAWLSRQCKLVVSCVHRSHLVSASPTFRVRRPNFDDINHICTRFVCDCLSYHALMFRESGRRKRIISRQSRTVHWFRCSPTGCIYSDFPRLICDMIGWLVFRTIWVTVAGCTVFWITVGVFERYRIPYGIGGTLAIYQTSEYTGEGAK